MKRYVPIETWAAQFTRSFSAQSARRAARKGRIPSARPVDPLAPPNRRRWEVWENEVDPRKNRGRPCKR